MLFFVKSFAYTPHASFSEVFLLPLAVLVRCFSYTAHASFMRCFCCVLDDTSSEVFLLHTSC